MRRATEIIDWAKSRCHISIHALHEESDLTVRNDNAVLQFISIHALHEESDFSEGYACADWVKISIHALHEESDTMRVLAYG